MGWKNVAVFRTDRAMVDLEDGGAAAIVEIYGPEGSDEFIRIQSWSEEKSHPLMDQLQGKRVSVQILVETD